MSSDSLVICDHQIGLDHLRNDAAALRSPRATIHRDVYQLSLSPGCCAETSRRYILPLTDLE